MAANLWIAMSAAKALSDAQLIELVGDLQALRQSLLDDLDAAGDISTAVTPDSAIGRLSRQDAMQQQQMALAERRRNTQRLNLVRLALEKVDENEYGYCVDCVEAIAYARLKVKPESLLCIGCQERREQPV